MKILVTGGNGLVGSAIKAISFLYEKHDFVFISSKDCDLTNYNETFNLFEKIKPDYVIHLAACVGGLFKNMKQKVNMFETNILINLNVLKCSHEHKVKKVVSCLSTCIFPDNTTYPINESMLHNGPPHFSNDAYAYAKRMLEIQSRAYQEQYGDNFICVIPTNIYGENDNFSLEDGHVIPALIHKCYKAKKEKEHFVVSGSGKPLRQFIYSKDLAKLIIWSLFEYNEKDSIILSVGEKDEISIKDVATLIAKELNYEYMMKFDETKPDGQFKKTADNTKLMSYNNLSNFRFIKIEDGLRSTIEWFIKNYANCRK
jgi:GDP-L-fucose synthase